MTKFDDMSPEELEEFERFRRWRADQSSPIPDAAQPSPEADGTGPKFYEDGAAARSVNPKRRRVLVVSAVTCLLVLVGLATYYFAVHAPAQREERKEKAAAKHALVELRTCQDSYQDVYDQLRSLKSSTSVGINVTSYFEEVRDLKIKLDSVDAEAACDRVAAKAAEEAYQKHYEAAQYWDDCVFEQTYCTVSQVELTQYWNNADEWLRTLEGAVFDVARRGLGPGMGGSSSAPDGDDGSST